MEFLHTAHFGGAVPIGTELVDGREAAPRSVAFYTPSKTSTHTPIGSSSTSPAGQPERPVPRCTPHATPATLPLGCTPGSTIWGSSPTEAARPEVHRPVFAQCHTTLNKDDNNNPKMSPEGLVRVRGTNMNYFQLAMLLAARETTEVYHRCAAWSPIGTGNAPATNLFQPTAMILLVRGAAC